MLTLVKWVSILFEQILAQVVLPAPESGLAFANPSICNSGRGPYVTRVSAICYSICYAPMHYISFTSAINAYVARGGVLPRRPLVVDLGCGPGTCGFAIADWLHAAEPDTTIRYLGIDDSREFLRLMQELAAAPNSGIDRLRLVTAVTGIAPEAVQGIAEDCDGVIFAASYILHQPFMSDAAPLVELMRRVRIALPALPAWFFCQDANFADRPEPWISIWPEDRIANLADYVLQFGYAVDNTKHRFRGRAAWLTTNGNFVSGTERERDNLCEFFQRIA